jgi:hypothetical protein
VYGVKEEKTSEFRKGKSSLHIKNNFKQVVNRLNPPLG